MKDRDDSSYRLYTGKSEAHKAFNSLRGISNLSRGISGLSRATSIDSNASALLRNPWEDKFFSMLMLGDNDAQAVAAQNALNSLSGAAAAAAMVADRTHHRGRGGGMCSLGLLRSSTAQNLRNQRPGTARRRPDRRRAHRPYRCLSSFAAD